MADLEFPLPLPPVDAERLKFYLDSCRERAWQAVGDLPIRERRNWPSQEKIRCTVLFPKSVPVSKQLHDSLMQLVSSVGEVLWNGKTAKPFITIQGEDGRERLLVKVTYRKFVSGNCGGSHYTW